MRAIVVAFFALVLVLVGCMSADDLQDKIEAKVKVGASVEEIEAYLASDGKDLKIESGQLHADGFISSNLEDKGVSRDTPVYVTIRRGNPAFPIYFVLDDDLRLERVIVIKSYTGP